MTPSGAGPNTSAVDRYTNLGGESLDDVRICKLSPPVEVGVVLPGELHEVDAGHGVVHHKVQGPLNAAVHVGPGRQVEDHLGAGDIRNAVHD